MNNIIFYAVVHDVIINEVCSQLYHIHTHILPIKERLSTFLNMFCLYKGITIVATQSLSVKLTAPLYLL